MNDKKLTIKDLKDAFGEEYEVINCLVKGKPDDYVLNSLADLEEYFVWILWDREDIRARMDKLKVALTEENVNKVFEELVSNGENTELNENDYIIDWVNEDIDQVIGELFDV